MASRARVVIALIVACAGGLALGPQIIVQPPTQAELSAQVEAYRALVVQYTTGNANGAIAGLTRHATLETVRVQRLVKWDPAMMRAAAMLETDTAFDSRTPISSMSFRLDCADNWLEKADVAERAKDPRTFRQRWHEIVPRVLIANGLVSVADGVLATGIKLYPDDLDLQLTFATAKEAIALSAAVDLGMTETLNRARLRTGEIALSSARTMLERLVRRAPDSAEARLRLAHLHIMEKEPGRAAPLLEEARRLKPTPPVDYLASIMLGEIRAQRNELTEALELFAYALKLMPNAQTAYLANARALRSAGRVDEAAKVLQAMLSRREQQPDPWKQYPLGFGFDVSKYDELRRETRGQ